MEKQNITLSLPKDVLKKAKLLAVQQDTSLSALLTRLLTETVEQHERYAAARTANLSCSKKPLTWVQAER
jgi:hypothetical protein